MGGLQDDDYQDISQPYSECLKQLQDLLEQIVKSDSIPDSMNFDARSTWPDKVAEGYQLLFSNLGRYLETVAMLPEEYEYNEHLNVFIQCCKQLHLLPLFSGSFLAMEWATFCQLIGMIRDQYETVPFREKLRIQRRDAVKRYQEYCNYVDALFDSHSRLVVIRLDLGYQKEYATEISLEAALADMDRFFDNMRSNSLFADMVGYIVKTEFGIERGIHFHLLLFFNGARRWGAGHAVLARRIGEYWSSGITGERGGYWNCNGRADEFELIGRRGIGLIYCGDADLRRNLLEHVLRYVCKTEQYFRSKRRPKARLIRRGDYPTVHAIKLGRPRSIKD